MDVWSMFQGCLVVDLPRILNPLRGTTAFQGNHIKTQVSELALTLFDPPKLCTACDVALLVGCNAFKRTAVPAVAALSNLHHHGGIALCHDQIKFAAAAAVVVLNKHEPL